MPPLPIVPAPIAVPPPMPPPPHPRVLHPSNRAHAWSPVVVQMHPWRPPAPIPVAAVVLSPPPWVIVREPLFAVCALHTAVPPTSHAFRAKMLQVHICMTHCISAKEKRLTPLHATFDCRCMHACMHGVLYTRPLRKAVVTAALLIPLHTNARVLMLSGKGLRTLNRV